MPTQPADVEQMVAEGDQIQERFRTLLSPAIELTPPLISAMLDYADVAREDPQRQAFEEPETLGLQAEYFRHMNGVSGPHGEVPDYHTRHAERERLHAQLRAVQPEVFRRLHYLLFRIASGLSCRQANLVTPNYLRTLVGCAYHGGYIDERVGVAYYQALLALHQIDPHPDSNAYSKTSLVWLAGKLLEEQKGFGLFKNEPVTDELLAVASALN